ncbi:MAG: DUF4838 domain-containing protein [Paenibacillaceae bacterium]|nr:DUF4838 domain-containing protein [Paenibacillaceae bacterium]
MRIAIVVEYAPFAGVREAAIAEERIDWSRDGGRECNVCTECHAAAELADHLRRIAGSAAEGIEIGLIGSGESPGAATCLIAVGGAGTNPATAQLERESGRSVSASGALPSGHCRLVSFVHEGIRRVVLSGSDRTGTLYAAYAFLEKLGVRWYAPDEHGTVLPDAMALDAIGDFDESSGPAFVTRGLYSEFADDGDERLLDWAARNRINFARFYTLVAPHRLKKRGIRVSGSGHDMLHRFLNPRSEYPYRHALFGGDGKPDDPYPVSPLYRGDTDGDGALSLSEAHPEWFALIGGERSFRSANNPDVEGDYWGDNFCTSNPDAVSELGRRIVDDLACGKWQFADDYNIWMYDNGIWCECEACAQIGNLSSRMVQLVHAIRGQVKEAMASGRLGRNVRLMFPAYHELLPPPDRPLPADFDFANCIVHFAPIERCYTHTLDDPRCTETNHLINDWYRRWTQEEERTYRGEVLIGEYYNVSSFASMPVVLSRMIAHDIPYYYRTGTRHFFYLHMPVARWGMLAMNNALHAKLMWNPELDVEAFKEEFFRLYYKETAAVMAACYEKMELGSASLKYIKHYQEGAGKKWSLFSCLAGKEPLFPLRHVRYDTRDDDPNAGISFLETIQAYADARTLLNQALVRCEDETAGRRLTDDDMRLAYGEAMLQFYDGMIRAMRLLDKGLLEPARLAFRQTQLHAEHLERMTEPLLAQTYYPDLANGFKASWAERSFVRLAGQLGIRLDPAAPVS